MAIQLPNGKITRTLPEQVGFNTQKIEEIIKFLNESSLKDLVINLESASGVLSPEQYAIAELSPSYLVFDGGVFYKAFEDSDYIDYFLLLEKVSTENSDLDVSHWRIRIERDSRNYALDNLGIFTSYTKSQIDALLSPITSALSGKADLSGATFTGAVSAPTLQQANPNYNLDFNFSDQEGATIENIYNRFEVINNVLYAIVNMKLTNASENSINIYQISSGWKYLNSEIGNKIYDLEGKKVSESRTGGCLICAHEVIVSSNLSQTQYHKANGLIVLTNLSDANVCALICRWNDSPLTIPAGESRWITGRLFLTLL